MINLKVGDIDCQLPSEWNEIKLKDYSTGHEDKFVYIKGVVISEIKYCENQQVPMWPSVDVYVFCTGAVRNCMPGSLEIISNS